VQRKHKLAWANLTISILGLLMVALMLSQPGSTTNPGANLPVWVLFSTLCILGGVATLFPHLCSHTTRPPEDLEPSRLTTLAGIRLVHGHHPTCGSFSGHELELGEKTYCAACTGLLIGAIAALAVATLALIYRITPPPITGYLGLALVLLGLIYNPLLKITTPILRTLINVLLVPGFSLILIAADGHGNLGLLVIALSVYWMYTRIQLSCWSHDAICDNCEEPCEKKG